MPAERFGGGFDHFLPLLGPDFNLGAVRFGDVDGLGEFPDRIQAAARVDDQERCRQFVMTLRAASSLGGSVSPGGGLWPTAP